MTRITHVEALTLARLHARALHERDEARSVLCNELLLHYLNQWFPSRWPPLMADLRAASKEVVSNFTNGKQG